MWRHSAVLVAALLVACGGGQGEHCPGIEVQNPGRTKPVDLSGPIGYRAEPQIEDEGPPDGPIRNPGGNPDNIETVNGQPVAVSSNTRIIGGGCFANDGCYGLVTFREDARTAAQIVVLQPGPNPQEFTHQTNSFRFEEGQVIIDGGAALELADDFEIDCGADVRDPAQLVKASSFGVSFRIDSATGEVVGASCVGCY